MITREEVLDIIRNKEISHELHEQRLIDTALERISKYIRKGQFSIPNVGNNENVQRAIRQRLLREGLTVEFSTTTTQQRRKNSTSKKFEVTNARISVQ